jgi:hypothetical protein
MFVLAALASCTTLTSSESSQISSPGEVALADAQGSPLVTIRVSEAVLAVGDPRYRPEDKGYTRYSADNDPWKWTEEQRILASALDLRDLLTRMLCGPDADLSYGPSLQYEALGTCTGVSIAAWTQPSPHSVLVGRPSDFGQKEPFEPLGPYHREQRLLRAKGDQVWLLGPESAGVEQDLGDRTGSPRKAPVRPHPRAATRSRARLPHPPAHRSARPPSGLRDASVEHPQRLRR